MLIEIALCIVALIALEQLFEWVRSRKFYNASTGKVMPYYSNYTLFKYLFLYMPYEHMYVAQWRGFLEAGEVFHTFMFSTSVMTVCTAEGAKEVLNKWQKYQKNVLQSPITHKWLGDNIVFVNGEQWRFVNRRVVNLFVI